MILGVHAEGEKSTDELVVRMDERQKAMRDDLRDMKEALDNHVTTLSRRVTKLELWRAKAAGIALTVSALTAGGTALLFTLIVRVLGV